jgi:branched-chain amino acid transport system substrate-binding protein
MRARWRRSWAPGSALQPARVCLVRRAAVTGALATLAGLSGCWPDRAIPIGLMTGLSGHDLANAEDGRNGAMLAAEQRNAAGGVNGRELSLIVRDDGPDLVSALAAAEQLIALNVVAIVGPFASSAVQAILARIHEARLLTLSPTASYGAPPARDDYLIRLGSDVRASAASFARVLAGRGQRRVALAVAQDLRGALYAQAWSDAFKVAFRGLGGRIVAEIAYGARLADPLSDVMRQLLAPQPDALVLTGGTVGVARLAQQARKQAPGVLVVAAESAANAALIELGGRAVEGVVTALLLDVANTSARFRQFGADYRDRFGRDPGFPAVAAYDAVTVLAQALAQQRSDESLRDAVLRNSPYAGVQQALVFDGLGNTSRPLHFAVVRDGRFELLP